MCMVFPTSLVVFFYCFATTDILTKLLQQSMLFVFHCCGYIWAIVNSQVSVYRTIGPTLVLILVSYVSKYLLFYLEISVLNIYISTANP